MRYVLIVLGAALTVVGTLTLGLAALITEAVSVGSGSCASGHCSSIAPGEWFLWLALPLIALGVGLLILGVLWGLRTSHPTR